MKILENWELIQIKYKVMKVCIRELNMYKMKYKTPKGFSNMYYYSMP